MLQKNNNYIANTNNSKLQQSVNIPISLFESMQGKYFVGQTKTLCVSNESSAWAGLVNPYNSDINLYTNVFTISNFSDDYLIAEIWLNTNFPEKACISHNISPTNTSSKPFSKNKVDIKFIDSTTVVPENGVNIYKRIVPPNATLIAEEDGKFIEAPGGNYVVVIKSSSSNHDKVIVAFGWWEKSRC